MWPFEVEYHCWFPTKFHQFINIAFSTQLHNPPKNKLSWTYSHVIALFMFVQGCMSTICLNSLREDLDSYEGSQDVPNGVKTKIR